MLRRRLNVNKVAVKRSMVSVILLSQLYEYRRMQLLTNPLEKHILKSKIDEMISRCSIFSLLLFWIACAPSVQAINETSVRLASLETTYVLTQEMLDSLIGDYNHHLEKNHSMQDSLLERYRAGCQADLLYPGNAYELSSKKRIRLLFLKTDALYDCAWAFEKAYFEHLNQYHEIKRIEWAKFYSRIATSQGIEKKIPLLERNLEGIYRFAASLEEEYRVHLKRYH